MKIPSTFKKATILLLGYIDRFCETWCTHLDDLTNKVLSVQLKTLFSRRLTLTGIHKRHLKIKYYRMSVVQAQCLKTAKYLRSGVGLHQLMLSNSVFTKYVLGDF